MGAGNLAESQNERDEFAPVAMVFASSAIATFPPLKRSPMMPEPTTAASSNIVPIASAAICGRRHAAERGFTARMNALMNLPSTCGAMASTSIPCPLKKVRASSTL